MIRTKKFLLRFVLCMFACFSLLLSGCVLQMGGASKIEGTYKFAKLSYQQGGMTIEVEAGEEFMGMMTLSEDYAILTLNEDGSAEMTMNAAVSQTVTGTWEKVEDGKIALTFEGDTETVTCNGKKIEMESDGMKLVLKK